MTDDFFRSRLDQMIEARLALQFARQTRPLQQTKEAPDLLGAVVSGGKVSNAKLAPPVRAPDDFFELGSRTALTSAINNCGGLI